MDGNPYGIARKEIVSFLYHKQRNLVLGLVCVQIIKRHGAIYLQEVVQGKSIFVIEWPVASFIFEISKSSLQDITLI